jgi:hypothetical protein
MATSILLSISWANTALLIVTYIGYQTCKMLYRITLRPLAKLPGPKLAAATKYEFYFHGIRGGSYVYEISKMHDEYGRCIPV